MACSMAVSMSVQPNVFVPDRTLHAYDCPPLLPSRYLGWVRPVISIPLKDLDKYTAPDSVILLRLLKVCLGSVVCLAFESR